MWVRFLKKGFGVLWQPLTALYLKKKRKTSFFGLKLFVEPGVFHPGFFFTTKTFARFLMNQKFNDKKILEVGSGSGALSILCAKNGGKVTAIDKNPLAIKNTQSNADNNSVLVNCVVSDLFDNIAGLKFDIVIVNPPFFPKNPQNNKELAWYCGVNHDYFERFFKDIKNHLECNGLIWMVLSDSCDLVKIFSIALKNGFQFETVYIKNVFWENNFIIEFKNEIKN